MTRRATAFGGRRVWSLGWALVLAGCGPSVDLPQGASATGEQSDATVGPAGTGAGSSAVAGTGGASGADDESGASPQLDLPNDPLPCDLYNDACPVRTKCTYTRSDGEGRIDGTHCVATVAEPDGIGEACRLTGEPGDGLDTCAAGSFCWAPLGSPRRTCVAFCEGSLTDPTCPEACVACTVDSGGILTVCLPPCDPLIQDCAGGQGCYPVGNTFSCGPDGSDGGGEAGTPCQGVTDCVPGSVCLAGDSYPSPDCKGESACCVPLCRLGDPEACPDAPPGVECQVWATGGPGLPPQCRPRETLGICLVGRG